MGRDLSLSPPLPSMRHCLDYGLRDCSLPSSRVPFVREAGGAYTIHNEHKTLGDEGTNMVHLISHSQPVVEWGLGLFRDVI